MDVIRAVIAVLVQIMTTPGLPLRLGVMIAVALILGYFLYDSLSLWVRVGATLFLFVVFEEWVRGVFLMEIRGYIPQEPIVFAVLSLIVFGAGASLGMYVAAREKRRLIKAKKLTDSVIEEIKSGVLNGNGA